MGRGWPWLASTPRSSRPTGPAQSWNSEVLHHVCTFSLFCSKRTPNRTSHETTRFKPPTPPRIFAQATVQMIKFTTVLAGTDGYLGVSECDSELVPNRDTFLMVAFKCLVLPNSRTGPCWGHSLWNTGNQHHSLTSHASWNFSPHQSEISSWHTVRKVQKSMLKKIVINYHLLPTDSHG